MDYQVNRSLSAGIGASCAYSSSESQNFNSKSDIKLNLFEFTPGLECRLANGSKLIFACSLLYTKGALGMELPGYVTDPDIDTLNVNIVTGVSTKF
ncbi:MAG TPA: hypothetical protein PKJ75_06855 [Methanosarcina vacuolata]|nr:hypothetical protein [Methanosarcina vacuolata]HPS58835.1 hypothetical protein [Spirochaetota bacterium]